MLCHKELSLDIRIGYDQLSFGDMTEVMWITLQLGQILIWR